MKSFTMLQYMFSICESGECVYTDMCMFVNPRQLEPIKAAFVCLCSFACLSSAKYLPWVLDSLTCAKHRESRLLIFSIADLHTQGAEFEKDKKESIWK